MKYLVLDLETTGLNCDSCAIIQIAGYIVIDMKIKEEFNFLCRPHHNATIENQALETVGKSLQDIQQYPQPQAIYQQLISLFLKYINVENREDRFILMGYNITFDADFLRAWLSRYKNIIPERYQFFHFISFPYLDVMVLALNALQEKRHLFPNFKLGTVAKYLGITFNDLNLHNAMEDIYITYQMYLKISSFNHKKDKKMLINSKKSQENSLFSI